MLTLHPKLGLRVQDERIENTSKCRGVFGVQQTIGLGHVAPRGSEKEMTASVRSVTRKSKLPSSLQCLECVPPLEQACFHDLALHFQAHGDVNQLQVKLDLPACLPSVLHHISFYMVRGLTLVFTAAPCWPCLCW